MKLLLLRSANFLGSSAIGLLIAAWLINGVAVRTPGFIVAVVVFSIAQAILSPFVAKLANRYASAFLGGIGSWIGATVVVWLVSALATVLLPMLFVRKKVG